MSSQLASFLRTHDIHADDTIIIAYSTGPDSTYLLHQICEIHPKDRCIAVHIDHMLRGHDSTADADFATRTCATLSVQCVVQQCDVPAYCQEFGVSLEEGARHMRYEALGVLAQQHNARAILTAHTADDQVETLLYRCIKGTKLYGLSGIPEKNGLLLRPLLHTTKDDILTYLSKQKIDSTHDTSNDDTSIMRNHIRHNIVPHFSDINPEYHRAFDRLASYAQECISWISTYCDAHIHDDQFTLETYHAFPDFIQKEFIRHIYVLCNSGTIGLSEANIKEVQKFLSGPNNPTQKTLGSMKLIKHHTHVNLCHI